VQELEIVNSRFEGGMLLLGLVGIPKNILMLKLVTLRIVDT
jgi:hypothetical protein